MELTHLSKQDFLDKIADYQKDGGEWNYTGTRPCIVDFYASWCGPCKMLAPTLEELVDEYKGEIDIYKVDTEAETELSDDFQIKSIPTLLFCPVGEAPQIARGAMSKIDLKIAIDKVLLKK